MRKILKNDPLLLALAIFVIGCIGIVMILFVVAELNIEKQRRYVEEASMSKRKEILLFLNTNIYHCKSLAASVEYELIRNNHIDQQQFNTLSSKLLGRGIAKVVATYTPDSTVTLVYPLAKHIGLYETNITKNVREYEKKLEKNDVFIEGPVKMLESDLEVIIIHSPVIPNDNKMKIVSTFIEWNDIIKRRMTKDQHYGGVVYALINHNGEVIAGDHNYFKKDVRIDTLKCNFSINEWVLATYPEKGWTKGYSLLYILLGFVIISALSFTGYWVLKNRLGKNAKINALYRIYSENTGDALWMLDTKTWQVSFIGKNSLNIRGFRAKRSQYLRNFVPYEFFDNFTSIIEGEIEKYKTGEVDAVNILFESQIYDTKGELFWAEISAAALPTAMDRDVRELIGVARNINQRKKMELAIAESEKKYKLLAENIKDVIFTMDLQTFQYKFITNTAYEMTGFSVEEYLFMSARDIFPRDFFAIIRDTVDAELKKYEMGETTVPHFRLEVQQHHKDGFVIWVELSARIISTVGENLDTIVAVSRNINERKAFESALQESEVKYRLIVENTKNVICTMDISISHFLFVSGACIETFGFTREEFLQIPVHETMPDKYYQLLSEQLQVETMKYLREEIANVKFTLELQQYRKNGSLIWVELSARMVTGEDGYLDKIVVIMNDISERKKMEFILQESERKHKLITENTTDSIWTMDPFTFKYKHLSPATVHITGYTREEVYKSGRTIFEVLSPEYSTTIKRQLKDEIQLFLNKEIDNIKITYEAQMLHKNGYEIWVETSLSSIVNEQNQLIEIVGITRRIDERKEMYFQILNQQRDLELLNSTKDKFFTIISHDLKNPFAALLNMSELLVSSYRSMNYQVLGEIIQVISKSTKYVYDLLENLLKWSRSSMGTMSYYPQKNDLIKLILETVIILKPQADAKNISIDININDTKYAFFDSNMIETVIRNLITNAIKFSPDGSVISVRVEDSKQDSEYYIVSVADDGVGLPQDKIDRLFKIGEKNISSKGTKNEMGTGLGLILCKEFIDKHGCDIYVKSEVGSGATFFFTVRKNSFFDAEQQNRLIIDNNNLAM